jgi:hypothetical protein
MSLTVKLSGKLKRLTAWEAGLRETTSQKSSISLINSRSRKRQSHEISRPRRTPPTHGLVDRLSKLT